MASTSRSDELPPHSSGARGRPSDRIILGKSRQRVASGDEQFRQIVLARRAELEEMLMICPDVCRVSISALKSSSETYSTGPGCG